jgi:hypothetical protein
MVNPLLAENAAAFDTTIMPMIHTFARVKIAQCTIPVRIPTTSVGDSERKLAIPVEADRVFR